MIVMGNREFSLGMKFAGIEKSYCVQKRDDGLKILAEIGSEEHILVNESVKKILPELGKYRNAIILPDSPEGFAGMSDLKELVKNVIGFEVEV